MSGINIYSRRILKNGSALFLIGFMVFMVPVILNQGRLFFTDQEMFIKTAEALRNQKSLVVPSELNVRLGTAIINHYNMKFVSRHRGELQVYPPLQSVLLACGYTIFRNYHVVAAIISALGIVSLYILLLEIGLGRGAFGAALLCLTAPVYMFYGAAAISDITSFVFLVITMLVQIRAVRCLSRRLFVVAGILAGLLVWAKYPNAVILPVFFLYAFIALPSRERSRLIPWEGGTVIAVLLLLMVYNRWAFGAFVVTGDSYSELKSMGGFAADAPSAFFNLMTRISPKDMIVKLANLPIYLVICVPGAYLALAVLGVSRRPPREALLPGMIIAVYFLFYLIASRNTHDGGNYSQSVDAAFHRYVLPSYCLSLIGAGMFLQQVNSSLKRNILIAIFTCAGVMVAWLAPINKANLVWQLQYQRKRFRQVISLKKHTEPGSVIIGSHVLSYVPNSGRNLIHCTPVYARKRAYVQEIERTVHKLLSGHIPVYMEETSADFLTLHGTRNRLVPGLTGFVELLPDSGLNR